MASRPEDELPDSIIVGQFLGLKNVVERERLQMGELRKALNVDIDDAGQARRRRGQTRVSTGSFHSLFDHCGDVYGVKDGQLGTIGTDYTFSNLATAGSALSYASVGDVLYYSSETDSGKIVDGANQAWGQTGGAGDWISPVISPTETLGEVAGMFLHKPPLASRITYYKGRIYLASRRWIWATELYLYDKVDRTKGFIQLAKDIVMLEAMENGIFVGTEDGIHFLGGTMSGGLKNDRISDAIVVPGSEARMPASRVYPQARDSVPAEGDAVVFLTDQGIIAGFDNGQIFNLTHTQVQFPDAASAAGLYREQDGVNQYIASADSRGDPSTSKVRIGDYVSAEIVRFQGG